MGQKLQSEDGGDTEAGPRIHQMNLDGRSQHCWNQIGMYISTVAGQPEISGPN